jgi:hypothetical protein
LVLVSRAVIGSGLAAAASLVVAGFTAALTVITALGALFSARPRRFAAWRAFSRLPVFALTAFALPARRFAAGRAFVRLPVFTFAAFTFPTRGMAAG